MSMRFLLLTEVRRQVRADDGRPHRHDGVRAEAFLDRRVDQPVRSVIPVGDDALLRDDAGVRAGRSGRADATDAGHDPAAALGAKLVTVFGAQRRAGLPVAPGVDRPAGSGDRRAARAARRPLHHRSADGRGVGGVVAAARAARRRRRSRSSASGVQARSHLEALARVHRLRQVTVWSPNKERRDRFVAEAGAPVGRSTRRLAIGAVDHAGEAVVGADIIVLVTSSPTPVLENGWVKPGAHVISVGACRPNQREMDPALTARARLFVDSRAAALVESGDVVHGDSGRPLRRRTTSSPSSASCVAGARRGAAATRRSRSSSRWGWRSRT